MNQSPCGEFPLDQSKQWVDSCPLWLLGTATNILFETTKQVGFGAVHLLSPIGVQDSKVDSSHQNENPSTRLRYGN